MKERRKEQRKEGRKGERMEGRKKRRMGGGMGEEGSKKNVHILVAGEKQRSIF